MQISGVFRALTLCLLATGFHGRVINAGQDSTVTEIVIKHSGFSEPTTLRDLLDLLGKLDESGIKARVLWKVEEMVQTVLTLGGIPGDSVKKNLDWVLEKIPLLRQNLLREYDQYRRYSDLTESDIETIVDVLIKWLPVLHSELWFLYFQTCVECRYVGGGSWHNQNFDQPHNTAQLHRWLTDQLDRTTVPYIPKGFIGEDLHESNRGLHIASNTGISLIGGGPLNYAQYGLFLLSPTWHHSNLGSVLLFLQEFCREIEAKKFSSHDSGNDTEALASLCTALTTDLLSLTDILHPLYPGTTDNNPYNDKLKPEAFSKYADWIKHNISSLKETLGSVLTESKDWTKETLNDAKTAGPFRYGLVFKDRTWVTSGVQLQTPDSE